jgi:prolyl oligopeptidase
MNRRRLFGFAVSLIIALVSGSTAHAIDVARSPGQRLKELVSAYWDEEMRSDPLAATFYGDHRFDDRLPDPSLDAHEAKLARVRATRAALERIDPNRLSPDDRLEYAILRHSLEVKLEREPFRAHLTPVSQLGGLQFEFARMVVNHPHATLGDVESYLTRLRSFPRAVDTLIVLLRQGMAAGRVPPRVTTAQMVTQLRALAAPPAEQSPFWEIVARLPREWAEADRKDLADRLRTVITTDVAPSYARLASFVENEYLPACRETVGLWDTPDGLDHYAHLVRSYTTTNLAPDEVHAIGLVHVAKARAAMEEVRRKVGFAGDLEAFFAHLKSDPSRRNTSAEGILARHKATLEEIRPRLSQLFGRLPRTECVLRSVEPFRARTSSSGSYHSAPADGSRPAYFYVNTSDPTGRPTYSMQALAYHESVPGHHIQIALAHEIPNRSAFRRYAYFPAFSEGWAVYSEQLPCELGLYVDPYSEFGRLENDAWRSARLVVDTGLHHKRWTREQAIAYLAANSSDSPKAIAREVDRYIAWPGQALAYKIGELKIREIRARIEQRLGKAFDVRAFHDRLLSFGPIPLGILEREMEGT